MNLIFDTLQNSKQKELPFIVYRKPNAATLSGFFQKNNNLFFTENFTESGFVFAPFNDENNAILIPENQSQFLQEKIAVTKKFTYTDHFAADSSSKETHLKLVENALCSIHKNQLKKVVVSRKEAVQVSDVHLIEIYQKLLAKYPNVFVYVWYHPKVGLWLGATPETLLHISDTSFETMSLAGTQVYYGTKNVLWKNKEIEEQLLVTAFIESQLSSIATNVKINKTETVRAGNLLHLKTTISGTLINKKSYLKNCISALHPTPAVCGLPRDKAKDFILENEHYQRTFYTGFLGELHLKNKNTSLFVNLRCMEIEHGVAQIYIGGGITKDSNPEKEWEETVSKSNVMKSVL